MTHDKICPALFIVAIDADIGHARDEVAARRGDGCAAIGNEAIAERLSVMRPHDWKQQVEVRDVARVALYILPRIVD